MSVSFEKMIEEVERIAPVSLREPWDADGVQIRPTKIPVEHIMVALEINQEVIEEALQNKVDFLLIHHPLFFSPIKKIDCCSVQGNYITALIKGNIAVYASHTPFDKTIGGNNDYVLKLLGLKKETSEIDGSAVNHHGDDISVDKNFIAVIGSWEKPKGSMEVVSLVQEKLRLSEGEFSYVENEKRTEIKKVAVCTGAGADLMDWAYQKGCQAFITGDVKHHQAFHAKELGMMVLDAGHYGTEKFFGENFANHIKPFVEANGLRLSISSVNTNPKSFR